MLPADHIADEREHQDYRRHRLGLEAVFTVRPRWYDPTSKPCEHNNPTIVDISDQHEGGVYVLQECRECGHQWSQWYQ